MTLMPTARLRLRRTDPDCNEVKDKLDVSSG
jgi:hypothetical protein